MSFRSIRCMFAVAILAASSAKPARAADITFDLTQIAFGQAASSLTVGDYTLLFTSTNGVLAGTTNASTGGLAVSQSQSFTIQKTAGPSDLIFTNYRIGNFNSATAGTKTFNLTGGTGTSTGNSFASLTTFNYNGSYSIVGSQTVTYSLVNFGNAFPFPPDSALFNTLTFTPVPEPSTYALGAIAAAVVGVAARRRRGASEAV